MTVFVLEGYGTDSRYADDVRHREYTTSQKKADLFKQIPRIQFTDSGHGIVFDARPHSGPRKRTFSMEYVREQMQRLKDEQRAENKPARPSLKAENEALRSRLQAVEAERDEAVRVNKKNLEGADEMRSDLVRQIGHLRKRADGLLAAPNQKGEADDPS